MLAPGLIGACGCTDRQVVSAAPVVHLSVTASACTPFGRCTTRSSVQILAVPGGWTDLRARPTGPRPDCARGDIRAWGSPLVQQQRTQHRKGYPLLCGQPGLAGWSNLPAHVVRLGRTVLRGWLCGLPGA